MASNNSWSFSAHGQHLPKHNNGSKFIQKPLLISNIKKAKNQHVATSSPFLAVSQRFSPGFSCRRRGSFRGSFLPMARSAVRAEEAGMAMGIVGIWGWDTIQHL